MIRSLREFGIVDSGFQEDFNICVRTRRLPRELVFRVRDVVSKYFPELRSEVIYLYSTTSGLGQYRGDRKVALNPELLNYPEREVNYTIGHELTHLIQDFQDEIRERALGTRYGYLYLDKIPKGEKACDIWVFARDPSLVGLSNYLFPMDVFAFVADWNILEDIIFGFCEKFAVLIHELAKDAIRMKCEGRRRNYIRWFESMLGALLREYKFWREKKIKNEAD